MPRHARHHALGAAGAGGEGVNGGESYDHHILETSLDRVVFVNEEVLGEVDGLI